MPIVVGQNVSAYHKRAKLLSRGQVLTADYERGVFRVQFERPELGSEVCSVRPAASQPVLAHSMLRQLTPLMLMHSLSSLMQDTELAVHGAPSLLFARPQQRAGMDDPFLQVASLPFLAPPLTDYSASGDTQDISGSGAQVRRLHFHACLDCTCTIDSGVSPASGHMDS